MIQRIGSNPKSIWKMLKRRFLQDRRILLAASIVAACIIFLRLVGLLQYWEWAVLDEFFRWRPPQSVDERVLIVGIDEETVQQVKKWPIPDSVIAQALQKLYAVKPRAIGLDIYRDLSVEPGHAEWVNAAKSIPNLIGIEQLEDQNSSGVLPPPILNERGQVGFNNVVIDTDDKVRRSLLYCHINGKLYTSFALKLALTYLAVEGIKPQPAKDNPAYLQVGKGVFRPLKPNDGAYVRTDAKGYQILANFKGPSGSFRTVSMTQLLADRVPPEWVRDRIVLIGSTAISMKDFFSTPYSGGLIGSPQRVSGVEVQANFIIQILDAAHGKPVLFNVLPEFVEGFCIWLWCWLGVILIWRSRSLTRSVLDLLLLSVGLIIGSFIAFLVGWWLPLVPSLLALVSSSIAIVGYIAHQEKELKRSKEFLQNLLNAIPDPIFVKNKQHQWIVLNEAYCQFLGHPLDVLLNQSDYDFFPSNEAEIFWHQDDLIFQTGQAYEHEETFTDIRGYTHLIATKRSLHKDAAGNLFLVGVIRDITERKQLEKQLKRQAEELALSNAELKVSEERLRHIAYHDSLTGLANRKFFYERLNQSLKQAKTQKKMIGLLFLDLDGFKQINDTHGHDMGDLLLQTVGKRLTGCLRHSDTVSRLGGDEFTIILSAISSVADSERIAEKILATITQPFVLSGQTIHVTTSIGISVFPLHGNDIDTLIKNADAAMYRAKQLGKNKYEFS